ncbi:MAG: CDP-diacylglycerol--serine O-phosphatidyltransferase [Gammaproteobacteria bacterium]|nr:CDP-diacylglycerol--serine O-phosphatidyltransferase [Gammaproteobacteria bacterium]
MANEQGRPRRGIYLLPNLFTTGALFAGFYSIIAAIGGDFAAAGASTVVALFLDGFDGRVARMTGTSSAFGAEYDSMADMISFGAAPALVVYFYSLQYAPGLGIKQLGWLAAFVYTACAGLRLARFNVQVGSSDKRFFQGLASPSAALLVMSYVWSAHELGVDGREVVVVSLLITLVSGILMITNFAYYSFKDFDFKRRLPFVAAVLLVVGLSIIALHPPRTLFILFLIYALHAPVLSLWRWLRRRQRK